VIPRDLRGDVRRPRHGGCPAEQAEAERPTARDTVGSGLSSAVRRIREADSFKSLTEFSAPPIPQLPEINELIARRKSDVFLLQTIGPISILTFTYQKEVLMAGLIRFAGGSGEGLSGAQETALAALREGQTFVAAAQRAGVARATVYRWVQSDPHFQAAYNLWQRELAESARVRLLKLTDKAVEVIEKALARNDEQVAMQMLRHTGVLRRRREQSTDVEVLGLQNELKQRREHQRVAQGLLHGMLAKAGVPLKQREQIISGADGGQFLAALDARKRLADASRPQDETNDETCAPEAATPPAEAPVESEGHPTPNPLPQQKMDSETPAPILKLAGETEGETSQDVSRDSEPEQNPQMVEGWRVGTKLYAVP
jgi:hypothetical protein